MRHVCSKTIRCHCARKTERVVAASVLGVCSFITNRLTELTDSPLANFGRMTVLQKLTSRPFAGFDPLIGEC